MSFLLFVRSFVCMFGLSPVSFAFANIPANWSFDLKLALWQITLLLLLLLLSHFCTICS